MVFWLWVLYTIWYSDSGFYIPYGILTLGSIYHMVFWLWVLYNIWYSDSGFYIPYGILTLGSIYHMVFWLWVLYTIWYSDSGFYIPYGILTLGSNFCHSILNSIIVNWIPSLLPKEHVHNAIRRGFNIPWAGCSIYHE